MKITGINSNIVNSYTKLASSLCLLRSSLVAVSKQEIEKFVREINTNLLVVCLVFHIHQELCRVHIFHRLAMEPEPCHQMRYSNDKRLRMLSYCQLIFPEEQFSLTLDMIQT